MMDLEYCFKDNKDFTPFRTEKGKGFLRKEYDTEELRRALENPSSLLEDAHIFKDSRTTKAGITELKGNEIFVKSFNNKGLGYTIKYIFRVPRPFRVFKAAWAFEQAEIPTPKPIAAIAEFSGLLPKNAFLIRESVPEIVPTLDFFKIILEDDSKRENFIKTACALYAKMHNYGIYHGDAKCSNIYVCRKGDSFDYGVWDLLSCQIENKPINKTLRNKEIARFANSFAEITNRLEKTLPSDATEENIFKIYNS